MEQLFSAGDCPTCADSGAVILLKSRGSGLTFFLCPMCGVAWQEPPSITQLDTVFELAKFAPDGVVLPTAEEASETGFSLTEIPFGVWYPLLEDLVR
jgi:hypothetical protein